ncbi:hypothetical protein HK096_005991 [Nowakowskiella sp. JEL0078]|nr:hypothetical protein HK096_005991 [Nowakowskiella sp. JEL0078]
MKADFIGEHPTVKPGTVFKDRRKLREAGIHGNITAGIHGSGEVGCYSIVLNGRYADSDDGSGGKSSSRPGSFHPDVWTHNQEAKRGNLSLITSCKRKLPVRVTRGTGASLKYSPNSGYRYDGIYYVNSYDYVKEEHGFMVYKFHFSRSKDGDGSIKNFSSQQTNSEPSRPTQAATQFNDLSRITQQNTNSMSQFSRPTSSLKIKYSNNPIPHSFPENVKLEKRHRYSFEDGRPQTKKIRLENTAERVGRFRENRCQTDFTNSDNGNSILSSGKLKHQPISINNSSANYASTIPSCQKQVSEKIKEKGTIVRHQERRTPMLTGFRDQVYVNGSSKVGNQVKIKSKIEENNSKEPSSFDRAINLFRGMM